MASGRSKGIKTKDDTWRSEELSRELKKAHKSDKSRTTDRSGGLKDRHRNPSKDSDITGEKRSKHDEKKRGVRESDKREHSPATTKASSTKTKEKVIKETSSPKQAHSPGIPKKTHSPKVSHSPLPRKASELVNSPLIKNKRDKSDKPAPHSKEDIVSQSSPQRSRRDRNQGDGTPKQTHHDRVTTKLEKKATAKLKESKEHFDMVQMEEVIEDISQQDGDSHGYSDDQFEEDYEEDFDDEESDQDPNSPLPPIANEDIDDIMKAIDSENQDVDQMKSQDSLIEPSAPSSHSLLSPRPPAISFSSPSKHQTVRLNKTSRKMRARADELSHLISTDVMAVSLFELNPQSEYDFYMRSFGTNNSHQTGTQTGCDHEESDTQTEDIITTDRWTQCPAHDLKGYGGTSSDLMDDEQFVQFNLESLWKFIGKAGKVVTDLLEEEEQSSIGQQHSISPNEHSDPYCSLVTTIGREGNVTCVDWTPTHPDLYLIGYDNGSTTWRGSCELWNVSKSFSPLFYLGNHSIPMACCLSFPLIICGNDDGTLVVWDLREPSSMHKTNNSSEDFNKLNRIPTFTTAALGWDSGHNEPILCLNSTTSNGSSNDLDWQDQTMKGLSSQLLSMDRSGQVCVWVVVEVSEPDTAGSDTDLGLVPGGKIKLIANSSFRIFDPFLASPYISYACIKDINSNSLLIGTDNGNVVCHIRYKATSSPRTYSAPSINVNQTVTAISIHPFFNNYFLVGYSSGHIALYYSNASKPLLLSPSMNSPVLSVHWHSSLPSVFTALCENSDIHIWDLLDNDAQPVHKIKPTNKLISSLPASFDSEAAMIVCQQSGLIDIYRFKGTKLCHENDKESLQDYFMSLRCNLTA